MLKFKDEGSLGSLWVVFLHSAFLIIFQSSPEYIAEERKRYNADDNKENRYPFFETPCKDEKDKKGHYYKGCSKIRLFQENKKGMTGIRKKARNSIEVLIGLLTKLK